MQEAVWSQNCGFFTAPTELIPTDGIVRKTALEATRGAKTEMEKARKLYDWVVVNTSVAPVECL